MKIKLVDNRYSNNSHIEPMPMLSDFVFRFAGENDKTIVCFLRLLCHYWFNNCDGLKDDDEMLARVARCDFIDWPKVKERVFNNEHMFEMDSDNLWQSYASKRDCEDFHRLIKSRQAATAIARVSRLGKFKSEKAVEAVKVAKLQKKNA